MTERQKLYRLAAAGILCGFGMGLIFGHIVGFDAAVWTYLIVSGIFIFRKELSLVARGSWRWLRGRDIWPDEWAVVPVQDASAFEVGDGAIRLIDRGGSYRVLWVDRERNTITLEAPVPPPPSLEVYREARRRERP